MRHELAAESLLSAAGINYDYQITADQDSAGTDLMVEIDDQWHSIDTKASQTAEDRAHEKSSRSHADPRNAYF